MLLNFVETFILHWLLFILNKLATIVYSLCYKKQTPELLLDLSFKAELPAKYLQDIPGFKICADVKK